jgi:autotransporter-associated beta strand protein
MFEKLLRVTLVVSAVLASAVAAQAITIEMVTVGDAGNAADTRVDHQNRGAVASDFNIGKYEVMNSEYAAFLNAVAATDTNTLYNSGMQITRSGVSGSYTYAAISGKENFPITYITWGKELRFANWMHNGQPTGAQNSSTTEDGAYDMTLTTGVRKAGAKWFVPNIDEWYKAAFYKGGGTSAGYWEGPYKSDNHPTPATAPGTFHAGGSKWDSGAPGAWSAPIAVGSYNLGDSVGPYGTYDQGGNIWEVPQQASANWIWILGGGGANDGNVSSTAYRCANPWSENNNGTKINMGFRMASAVVVTTGNYWDGNGAGAGGGGPGNWTSDSQTFATDASGTGGGASQGSGTIVFAGTTTPAAVTVGSPSPSANAGLQFSTTGYTLSGGTLTLGSANAGAKTITTDTDVTAEISAKLSTTGNAGMIKKGQGTLVLSNAGNDYGPTTVSEGTLLLKNANAMLAGSDLTIEAGGTVILDSNLGAAASMASNAATSATAVPEPGTIALLAAGLAGLLVAAWRRRRL